MILYFGSIQEIDITVTCNIESLWSYGKTIYWYDAGKLSGYISLFEKSPHNKCHVVNILWVINLKKSVPHSVFPKTGKEIKHLPWYDHLTESFQLGLSEVRSCNVSDLHTLRGFPKLNLLFYINTLSFYLRHKMYIVNLTNVTFFKNKNFASFFPQIKFYSFSL